MGWQRRWIVSTGLAIASAGGCMSWTRVPVGQSEVETASVAKKPASNEKTPSEQAAIWMAMATTLEKKVPSTATTPKEQAEEKADASARILACYENAERLKPGCTDHLAHHLAILYDKAAQPESALAKFQKALQQKPKDANLLNDLGYHWYNCGNWADAEKYYRQALAIDSRNSRATMNLGLTLVQQDQSQDAFDCFCKVVSPSEAYCNLGFCLMTQKKYDQARSAFQQAVAIDPSSIKAKSALAKLDGGATERDSAPVDP